MKDKTIKCATSGCIGKARKLVVMIDSSGSRRVQMCNPCATAFQAGQVSGWNGHLATVLREQEIERQVIRGGY